MIIKKFPDEFKSWTGERKQTLVGCGTSPVGQKGRNELNLSDMTGNVWEWCWDLFGTSRRIRGCGWRNTIDYCVVSYRNSRDLDTRSPDIGVRLARSL